MGLSTSGCSRARSWWTDQPYGLDDLDRRLAAERFDVVIDLSPTMDKRLSIGVCDGRGVSLVNSTMVDYKDDIHIAAYNFLEQRPIATRRPHIVASGMNPAASTPWPKTSSASYDLPDAICTGNTTTRPRPTACSAGPDDVVPGESGRDR